MGCSRLKLTQREVFQNRMMTLDGSRLKRLASSTVCLLQPVKLSDDDTASEADDLVTLETASSFGHFRPFCWEMS